MFQFLQSIIHTPAFYFITGILLIVLFFWYLAAEEDKVKRNAGTFFIIGLCSFSLLSLFLNGMHYGIDIRGGVELTLEVQPKLNDHGEMQQPTQEDMQQACDILNERLNATGTSEVQILHSGRHHRSAHRASCSTCRKCIPCLRAMCHAPLLYG